MPWPTPTGPLTLADYVASMARAVFVSGISWKVIDAKWEGIRAAFDEFDPQTVAGYTPADVDRLMDDTRVIRNRKKLQAIVDNTGELIVVDREFGGVDNYLESFDDNDALIKDLHKRFAFLGESVAHFFLFGVHFNYPAQEAWAKEHFAETHGHHVK
jgi:3-methyladenine DNA glycosylase Tag